VPYGLRRNSPARRPHGWPAACMRSVRPWHAPQWAWVQMHAAMELSSRVFGGSAQMGPTWPPRRLRRFHTEANLVVTVHCALPTRKLHGMMACMHSPCHVYCNCHAYAAWRCPASFLWHWVLQGNEPRLIWGSVQRCPPDQVSHSRTRCKATLWYVAKQICCACVRHELPLCAPHSVWNGACWRVQPKRMCARKTTNVAVVVQLPSSGKTAALPFTVKASAHASHPYPHSSPKLSPSAAAAGGCEHYACWTDPWAPSQQACRCSPVTRQSSTAAEAINGATGTAMPLQRRHH
jgi:hypothetical protein